VRDRSSARRRARFVGVVLGVLAIAALAVWWMWPAEPPRLAVHALAAAQPPPPRYDLVLAGSNTMGGVDAASGKGLARDLIIGFVRDKYRLANLSPDADEEIGIPGEDETDRRMTFVLPEGKTVRVLIRPHGSETAVPALMASDPDGSADIGMSSHPQPKLRGAEFVESVIAVDAVAVIVHRQNPIQQLTLEQLRNIFGPAPDPEADPSPPIRDWGKLPNAISGPIHTYGRDKKSGTTECFRERTGIDKLLASLGRDPKDRIPYSGPARGGPGYDGYEDTQKVIDSVRNDPQAIGYIGRAASNPPNVNVVRIRPADLYSAFSPTLTSIATMEYGMTRELYFYRRADARPLAAEFVKFCLSDRGQQVVNEAGFVGFRTDELVDQKFSLGDHAPRALQRKVAGYDRIRASFRFKSDSTALDTISDQNMTLLLALLKKAESRRLVIVGSADSVGNPSYNLALSKDRARRFKQELEQRGVRNAIETEGYGKEYLLYDDHGDRTSLEAQRNRRVEIYIERDRAAQR
jgi:phosphate transport system substrate-binding protein